MWNHTDYWPGQLPRRPKQKAVLEIAANRQSLWRSRKPGQGKSQLIRKMLRIRQFDHRWTLPSMMDENPMVWMLEVNGFLMDIRHAPRELQEVAFEKGLIPYVPADRVGAGEESSQE